MSFEIPSEKKTRFVNMFACFRNSLLASFCVKLFKSIHMFVKQILPFMDVFFFQSYYCCGEKYVLLSTIIVLTAKRLRYMKLFHLSRVLRALVHSAEEMVTVEPFTEDH